MIVFFSLLPQILATAQVPEPTLWRAASAAHAAYLIAVIAYRNVRLQTEGTSVAQLGWGIAVVLGIASLQLANAIWMEASWVYLSALAGLILVVFSMFPRLLNEIWMATTDA